MANNSLDEHFLAIWLRALNEPTLSALNPSLIKSWAIARNLTVERVEEQQVGAFNKTRSIVLTVAGQRACFPMIPPKTDPAWEAQRRASDHIAALWEKMEWFCPLWLPLGDISKLLSETTHCTKARAIELFNYHTSTLYTLAFQAVCIAQIMTKAHSLTDFCPLAREAYLAFYSGYRASSIAALIPVIEGAITRIVAASPPELPIADKVGRAIGRAIETAARLHFDSMWVPREYLTTEYLFGQDERVFAFETYRRWLLGAFFRKSAEYSGQTWLNRHLFAHGATSSWQESANFSRLIVALTTLAAIESWHDESHRVSFFMPEMNDDGRLLHQQALFRGMAQHAVHLAEEKRFREHGRLVPSLPTDDGSLLRKAILSEDGIKDLVRPLRNAGWQVTVREPDASGLYMTATATHREGNFTVALLNSCATDNALYKMLAKTCRVILYRGAPYMQEQFAHGLTIHVGPVAAWQSPVAPKLP